MTAETNHELNFALSGRFVLYATKADGSASRKIAEFNNLILDLGLNYLCGSNGGSSMLNYCQVGSGSTAPATTQSRLVAQKAWTTRNDVSVSYGASAPYVVATKNTYRFGAGIAAGNISEIGVGWGQGGDVLFSRALILDANGNPTTVTVLSDEFLDVSYTLSLYPSTADSRATLNINGTAYEVTSRISSAGSKIFGNPVYSADTWLTANSLWAYSSQALGAVTDGPTGTPISTQAEYSRPSYSAGAFYADTDIILGLDAGNLNGGIGALQLAFGYFLRYQMSFSPKMPKTQTQVFRLRLRISFVRR